MTDFIALSFADDMTVIAIGDTCSEVGAIMNNIEKYITFGNNCNGVPKLIDIKSNVQSINRVALCKYHGIICDYRLC